MATTPPLTYYDDTIYVNQRLGRHRDKRVRLTPETLLAAYQRSGLNVRQQAILKMQDFWNQTMEREMIKWLGDFKGDSAT